jgi:hypothetical protein
MKVLLIADPQNTFVGTIGPKASGWFKKDGNEFRKQAENAQRYYESINAEVDMYSINGKNAFEKRQRLFSFMRGCMELGKKYDRIIFFCHGHKKALNRKMIKQGVNLGTFATRLRDISSIRGKIILFSCKTAANDDGFAFSVSCHSERPVVGHKTSGHTTRNPYKRLFLPSLGYDGEDYIFDMYKGKSIRSIKKELNSGVNAPFEYIENFFIW